MPSSYTLPVIFTLTLLSPITKGTVFKGVYNLGNFGGHLPTAVKIIRVTNTVAVPVPVPFPVTKNIPLPISVPKPIPYAVPHPIPFEVAKPVVIPQAIPVGIPKPYAVPQMFMFRQAISMPAEQLSAPQFRPEQMSDYQAYLSYGNGNGNGNGGIGYTGNVGLTYAQGEGHVGYGNGNGGTGNVGLYNQGNTGNGGSIGYGTGNVGLTYTQGNNENGNGGSIGYGTGNVGLYTQGNGNVGYGNGGGAGYGTGNVALYTQGDGNIHYGNENGNSGSSEYSTESGYNQMRYNEFMSQQSYGSMEHNFGGYNVQGIGGNAYQPNPQTYPTGEGYGVTEQEYPRYNIMFGQNFESNNKVEDGSNHSSY